MNSRQKRTDAIIKHYRGLPGEWEMLKGLLCMTHPFDCSNADFKKLDACFDGLMIAARMDEITRELFATANNQQA